MKFTDGPYQTVPDDAEILTEAWIPIRPGVGSAYEKVERAGDWAVASARQWTSCTTRCTPAVQAA